MDALTPGVVDVFLGAVSQVQGSRSGPIGRITSLKNGVVTHYSPGQGLPSRIKVQQRNGFRALTTNGHSSETGAPNSPEWSNPELLSALGNQILSIANAIPRVYDGTDWTNYGAERVVTNRLSETTFHTSQRTIQAQDHAIINGVTCSVWSESTNPESTATVVYIGFKDDDGAWVRTPQILYDPGVVGDHVLDYARVISDTVTSYFWVVFNSFDSVPKFTVKLFDTNGRLIDTDAVDKIWETEPGFWDIVQIPDGGCLIAQPLHTEDDALDGVKFSAFTQTAGNISIVTTDNSAIKCRGALAWVTNDLGDENCYLTTVGLGEDPPGKLWGYQIDPADPDPVLHEYNFGINFPADTVVDSLVGFTVLNTNPDADGVPDLYVSYTLLNTEGQTSGPPFDPQLRYSKVYRCDFADNVTFIRQNNYTCQVSRAFLHDDEYYTINYYQSGSGNTIESTQVEVDHTPGDYMIGQKLQEVKVQSGDYITGSEKTHVGAGAPFNNINVSSSQASFATTGADTVEFVNVSLNGLPVRTVLKWTLANLVIDNAATGGRLVIGTEAYPGANGAWDILGADNAGTNNYVYTSISNIAGGTIAAGTLTGGGTGEVLALAIYRLPTLGLDFDNVTKNYLVAGTAVITGNGTPANNGTKTIQRAVVGWTVDFDPFGLGPGVWILVTSEASSNSGFTAVVSAPVSNQWNFAGNYFDESLEVGPHGLIVEHSEFTVIAQQFNGGVIPTETPATNDSFPSFPISNVTDSDSIETEGTAITAEQLKTPFPTVTIEVPADVTPLTFYLQDVVPDYTYQGATLIVRGDTVHDENNGVYTITGFDTAENLLYCAAADGHNKQRSQMFVPDDQTIVIIFNTNVQPEFQPCWLMVPLTGSKPVVGRFEYGLAYADWRYEGSDPSQLFPLSVMSPVMGSDGWRLMLPYRAISFTVGQSIATANGQVLNAAVPVNQSTVGLKQFTLNSLTGNATVSSSQLLLPGPMCAQFTASGFTENGVNFGFEAPYLISQQVSSNAAAMRVGGTYQVIAVAEVTEEDGDRVFSIVSPPLNFTLTGDNNSATYGIRMLQPLDSAGNPVSQHFGVTNRRLLGISLYRTSYQNDAPTTDHHKITLDLNINGLSPVSATNASGFTFDDDFTAEYLDENIDASIINQEILYTDKGFLPRFPAPAQRNGDFWKQRAWVVGYDGAIWMSNEKREGDAISFFPLFRIFLPTTDKPVAVAEMDDYLIVGCEKSMWYIPAANFKDATGREGILPTPVQLPFSNGCTGHMITLREGVAYSSTDGGVWMVTRGLTNVWLSQTMQDSFSLLPVTGMSIDKRQRLVVACGIGSVFTYDQTVKTWYTWPLPVADAQFVTTVAGEIALQEDLAVWIYDPFIFYDDLSGTKVGIPIDIELSSFQFGNVRGLKSCWAMQIVGDYKGPHHINAVLSYPDDDPDNPTVFPDPDDGPYTPSPDDPYLLEINPMIEQASSFGLRIFTDFTDIEEPGDSCEIELISCEVGMDSSVGVNKFVDSRRIPGR